MLIMLVENIIFIVVLSIRVQFLRILNAYSWRAQFEILHGNFGYYAQNMYNISISFEYYFQSHLIYKWCYYYRQAIFNKLNIIVPYIGIICLCHSVAILWKIYLMQHKCHVRWHNLHFKWMIITQLGQ